MLQKWCEVTSCNGIIDLYESKVSKKRLSFWSVVMIGMISCSIWFTYKTMMGYIDTPTVTNVGAETGSSMDLPEVLLAYNGGLNVSAMKEANLSEEFVHAFNAAFSINAKLLTNNTSVKSELDTFMNKYNYSFVDVAIKFGFSCEDMVQYLVEPDMTLSRCENKKDFLTDRGNSFIFKSLSPQWYPGLWGGWRFNLMAPRNSYVKFYPERSLNIDMNEEFSITMERTMGHMLSRRSFLIPLNTKVEITLNTKLYRRVNGTSTCGTVHTTSNTCFFYCWMEGIHKCLHCLPYIAYGDGLRYNKSRICNPFDWSHSCVSNEDVQKCNLKCLPLCDEWIFEPTIAYSSLPPLALNRSYSDVIIGYNTMQYIKIEEVKAFTIDMAISNVGGQAGLWLGVSVITIIQAFYYLVLSFSKKNNIVKDVSFNTACPSAVTQLSK